MQNVLVYSPVSDTRKVYHRILTKREYTVYSAKDLAEFLIQVVTFEIDTVILVDESSRISDFEAAMQIMRTKYDHKRLIVVSARLDDLGSTERYASHRELFDEVE